ncbi:carbamoyl phosphate synthase small subunit [Paludifilum halophilum]|uniref:Carbamoyl phosphate synthase small chain n=1 Tax=Paludifilum halophilum TaxID=1642702 RepID=A0A235B703_9BACL|nr:carbamoyl phosphate synthase small subunit [Paludifilum halophilum]OYD08076.1 hypothetical protein CHM34_08150 [Paludifilum halophilum]
MKAYLVFEDGEVFSGEWIGSPREKAGEVVFTTGMTGYQEVATDPSYAGQIVTFTYPLIGNYGIIPGEEESARPHCSGVVISEGFDSPGDSFGEWLDFWGIPGIVGVDTRSVVKKVRERGSLRGLITAAPDSALNRVTWPDPLSREWVDRVAVAQPVAYPETSSASCHMVLVDFGYKQSMLNALLRRGYRVTVVPYHWPPEQIAALQPDGLLFSNGPGDPKALTPYLSGWVPLFRKIPTMGICLGHQLVALAFGGDTERLPYGHRGSNHPVKEEDTGKVWITSQNHGYTVKSDSLDPAEWRVTHRHVNDGSVEGIIHHSYPVRAVQFHPEAHPGPGDAEELFDRFLDTVSSGKKVEAYG